MGSLCGSNAPEFPRDNEERNQLHGNAETKPRKQQQSIVTASAGDSKSNQIELAWIAEEYKTSQHELTKQWNAASVWVRCSHTIHDHPIAVSDNEFVSFPSDRDVSIFYTYDSATDVFCKWRVNSMNPSERVLTAAVNKNTDVLYVITADKRNNTHISILAFYLSAKRWKICGSVRSPWINPHSSIIGSFVKNDSELIIVGNTGFLIWDLMQHKKVDVLVWNDGTGGIQNIVSVKQPLNNKEKRVFYLEHTQQLLVWQGGLLRYDWSTNRLEKVPLWSTNLLECDDSKLVSNFFADLDLNASACLMPFGKRYMLVFGGKNEHRIWIIDCKECTVQTSKIEVPNDLLVGSYGCLMTNTNNRAVSGYVRECWQSKEYQEMRFLSQDAIELIKSFYGSWYVHLFGRNGGFHFAMYPQCILEAQ